MRPRLLLWLAALGFAPAPLHAAKPASNAEIANYVAPYVDTRNFSGVILVARGGTPVFAKAYGYSDQRRKIPNRLNTRFHIASMSMQFTAAAALRLIDSGNLSLDTAVSDVVPDYPNGRAITVRNLLTQTSGVADINAQPGYDDLLKAHQTPWSLVRYVQHLPADRAPGTYVREEHSAYNLLALIIERRSGARFAEAMQRLVFRPLGMSHSGIDDDDPETRLKAAMGYQPVGLYGIEAAEKIHWSAKAGNASAYTTAADELKFIRGLSRRGFLSPGLKTTMFDLSARVGYGWFKGNSTRFGQPVYSMNGRAPGFGSAMMYLPNEKLFVVALSNIYASVPADMATEIAALALGRPHEALRLSTSIDPKSLAGLPASFRFPKDFYQPNAVVSIAPSSGTVVLKWPSGDSSVLIPTDKDHYIDRSYWMPVEVVRDARGGIVELKYGPFSGARAS